MNTQRVIAGKCGEDRTLYWCLGPKTQCWDEDPVKPHRIYTSKQPLAHYVTISGLARTNVHTIYGHHAGNRHQGLWSKFTIEYVKNVICQTITVNYLSPFKYNSQTPSQVCSKKLHALCLLIPEHQGLIFPKKGGFHKASTYHLLLNNDKSKDNTLSLVIGTK